MKKVLLSAAIIISCLFQSCSDSLIDENLGGVNLQTRSLNLDEDAEVSTITYNGENMLRFRDMDAYENTIRLLNSKTKEERIAYTNSFQVKTLSALLTESDKELDIICESSTIEDFRPKYEQFKNKYKEIFMFNGIDTEDLSAYSKLRNPMDDNIANKYGEFMIGDSLVQSSEFNDFSEFYSANIVTCANETSNPYVDINHTWSHWDKRKVGCYISMEFVKTGEAQLNVRFTAQKKFIFGWKRYSTEYSGSFYLVGSGTGFEFFETASIGGFVGKEKYVNKNSKWFDIHTRELSGDYTVNFGRVTANTGPLAPHLYTCEGSMKIWSRGIEKEHCGSSTVRLRSL